MDILAGEFGGRRIKTVSKLHYSPTKSRVRKSIFDSLMPFHFSIVLDLFSGSGILGFESASRGGRSVSFVEKHRPTLRLLKQNAASLSGPSYTFIHCSAESFLRRSGSFDLIFADPPYTISHNQNAFVRYNENLFSWSDQERLYNSLNRAKIRGVKIISTNAYHESILRLYNSML